MLSRDQSTDDETLRRFRNEAQSAARLNHENIAHVHYVGEDRGLHYIVFEFIEGVNIRDLVEQKGPLPLEESLSYTYQIARALEHASSRAVIHRDIKPANIMVDKSGEPLLTDVGLAKLVGNEGHTMTGQVMGTPNYMAPEQARGEHIDHRVDIYACGVMLYEILTGRRPFIAPSYNALVIQILSTTPRDPRELRPAIPDAFVSVVFKALAKHRAERYDDAKAFIAALDEVAMQLEHPLMNAPVDRLSQKAHEQSMAQYPSEPPASDSIDIPVHFSETGTGQHPVTLETGDVEVELDTGPRVVDDDPTMVAGRIGFEPRMAEDEVHDTIVDPTGALRGELFSHLGKTPESGGPKSRAVVPDRLVESVDKPQGEIDRDVGGRYSMISSSSEPSGPVWGYDRAAESKNTPRQSATRPSTAKRTRI